MESLDEVEAVGELLVTKVDEVEGLLKGVKMVVKTTQMMLMVGLIVGKDGSLVKVVERME